MKVCKRTLIIVGILVLSGGLSAQSVELLSPNGGEVLNIGEPVTITWNATDYTGELRILLFRGGIEAAHRVGLIADGIPASSGSFTWSAGMISGAPVSPGTNCFYLRIRAASAGGIVDHNDAPFTLHSTAPNIRCEKMFAIGWDHTFLPRTFGAGDMVTIKYHLVNDSSYPAGAFNVGLRVGGAIVARNPVAELVNGAEASGEFAWTATCGSTVEVVADCDNAITEVNESDNSWTDPGLACSQPNLSFFRTSFSGGDPTTAAANVNYQFTAVVHVDTVDCRDVRVTARVTGGAMIVDEKIPVLSQYDNTTIQFIWQVPAGASQVVVTIDPDNTISESNEGDNVWTIDLNGVVHDPATDHYDLSLRLDTIKLTPASSTKIPQIVKNRSFTMTGKIRGATGAIRSVIVKAQARYKDGIIVRISQQTISPITSLVVPFSVTWTPTRTGVATILITASPGAHATAVGVVDANPANNQASLKVNVVKPVTRLRLRR